MSSSDRPLPTRRGALALVLATAALGGGCLRPLYAENTAAIGGGNVKTALREIDIPEIKGLTGHYLRNELVFEFDGSGEPDRPKRITFNASVSDSIQVVSIDASVGRADSAVLVATVVWSLVRQGTGEVIASGTDTVRAPYERSTQRYATVRAARDARIRAAKSLAMLLRTRIAAELAA